MNSRQKILGVVAVVAIIAAGLLLTKRFTRTKGPDTLALSHVGEVAAIETVKVLGGNGRVGVILFHPAGGLAHWVDALLYGYSAKAKAVGLQVQVQEVVRVGQDDLGGRLRELAQAHRHLTAIVLLGGLGDLRGDDLRGWPEPHPQVVAILSLDPGPAAQLLEEKVLALAITARPWAEAGKDEDFAANYVVATLANIADLTPPPPVVPTKDSGLD